MQLPDVNVLVALMWEAHVHHAVARSWFSGLGSESWATCPITQTGFVRVSSNPKMHARAITVRQATAVLTAMTERDDHSFLPDAVSFVTDRLVPHEALVGYRQVTDAHLIGIARRHQATVVTLDSGIETLGGESVRLLSSP